MKTSALELPVPPHFADSAKKADQVWRVPYTDTAAVAEAWAKKYGIQASARDKKKIALLPIDCQNTFCLPGFELFVAGAVEDNVRLANFVYRYLGLLTEINPTLDTHTAMQIFHPVFWVNDKGEHPVGGVNMITLKDIDCGVWKVNPAVAPSVTGSYPYLQAYARHYVKKLTDDGKYPLMIWPYHAILGGIGHALAAVVEEAFFFHNIARRFQTGFQIKGGNPLSENYSVLRAEVLFDQSGKPVAQKNTAFLKALLENDIVIAAGQAKSHCFAWTIDDLLVEIAAQDPNLAKKVYLLEDCTSPVVIPGVIDFTPQANEAFQKFASAGMHVVKSTDPIESWPDINL